MRISDWSSDGCSSDLAAFDRGANRRRALTRVILPLAVPGIAAGCVLVFVPALGAYVTPELLGGGKAMMIGNLIQSQFGAARNWPFGAALAFALLAIVLLAMMVYLLRFRRTPAVTCCASIPATPSGTSAAFAPQAGCSSPTSTCRSWCSSC